jgi:hypothetical protein
MAATGRGSVGEIYELTLYASCIDPEKSFSSVAP